MIGGHGTGKSMMIPLEVSRAARIHADEGTEAKILIVVWEGKAEELLDSYRRFAQGVNQSPEVELKVVNKEQLCHETKVAFKDRDTTSIINDINKRLTEEAERAVYLFIDEIEVTNPGVSDLSDLVGKTPFCLGGHIFPWSNLEPLNIRLVLAVTTDSQDLVRLLDIEESEIPTLRDLSRAGKIPTEVLWRVFRSTNAIQDFVPDMQKP